MKKLIYILSFIIFGLALIPFCIFGMHLVTKNSFVSYSDIFLLIVVLSILIYLGFLLLSKYNENIMKYCLWALLILYIAFLFDLTILSRYYENIATNGSFDFRSIFDNIKGSYNLIPFDTISKYFSGYMDGDITLAAFFINILGNTFVFVPIALFVKLLFNPANRKFINVFFIVIIFIETIQVLFNLGKFDVDDIILNVFGTYLFYIIFGFDKVNLFLRTIFRLEKATE